MSVNRIAGVVEITANGKVIKLAGKLSSNVGNPKKEAKVGQDSVHGYSELPQVPFIEGEGRMLQGDSIEDLNTITDATVIAKFASGKVIMLSEAWNASEGTYDSEEGSIPFRFEGMRGKEVVA